MCCLEFVGLDGLCVSERECGGWRESFHTRAAHASTRVRQALVLVQRLHEKDTDLDARCIMCEVPSVCVQCVCTASRLGEDGSVECRK